MALLVAACGGQGEPVTPKLPDSPAPSPSAAAPTPAPSAGPSTTTGALAGDAQGTKLEPKRRHEPGRGAEDIQTIILTRRDDFRACYDRSLKDHPGVEGDLDVKWTIDPKGDVTEVSIDEGKSTIAEPGVRKCVMDLVRKIKFAESAKGLESHAHYPFNFNPRSGGKVPAADAGAK